MRLGITGHRGLSTAVERLIRDALDAELQKCDMAELCGVSCIADGPDAWFAEAVLARGGRIEVVVPAEQYRDGLPASHHAAYDALLEQAVETHDTGIRESTSRAHMAGSEILVGLVDSLVAVWDGEPARGYGGTADVVGYARRMGVPVRVVWPEGATRS
ncbi:hypothetical protein [Streptomyces celluloflavus]|uniref:hypothetical protein n=1 Tax=Streptomyces celluloflavus TaxID=58344 RepID=UPI00345F2792|nr:hypothetical protein OG717_00510 [Streptomyces celluloflavus]WSK17205.1 hypothetical protein OG717_38965 [Streptomyces celluloflavus]